MEKPSFQHAIIFLNFKGLWIFRKWYNCKIYYTPSAPEKSKRRLGSRRHKKNETETKSLLDEVGAASAEVEPNSSEKTEKKKPTAVLSTLFGVPEEGAAAADSPGHVLMVKTENISHEPFENNDEIKVCMCYFEYSYLDCINLELLLFLLIIHNCIIRWMILAVFLLSRLLILLPNVNDRLWQSFFKEL